VDWGYYCRTCGESSEPMFERLESLWQLYREAQREFNASYEDDTMVTETLDVGVVAFLAYHLEHDVWAECEDGVLRLGTTRPYQGSVLPERFTGAQRRRAGPSDKPR